MLVDSKMIFRVGLTAVAAALGLGALTAIEMHDKDLFGFMGMGFALALGAREVTQ